jgi:uncharacterized membrane protein YtjA (UPF0391 family)
MRRRWPNFNAPWLKYGFQAETLRHHGHVRPAAPGGGNRMTGLAFLHRNTGDRPMIKWILILLIVAAAASLLGMPALAGAAATGARILIGIVLIIFLLVVLGLFAVT